jgi:hypothetical protein
MLPTSYEYTCIPINQHSYKHIFPLAPKETLLYVMNIHSNGQQQLPKPYVHK